MNRDEAATVGRQHVFDQAKAQQEMVKQLKELNINIKALTAALSQSKRRPVRKRRGSEFRHPVLVFAKVSMGAPCSYSQSNGCSPFAAS